MPAKRNDVEESAAEREIAFTRVILAWVLVLVILFWITSTPSPTESSSVQFLIRGSLGGGDASLEREGECAGGWEMIRGSLAMPQVFEVPRRMMQKAWADPKPLEMTATFTGEDGKARVTMRMEFVPAEPRDHYVQEYGGWGLGRLQ
jgi:hypothetical protein